MCVCVCPCRTLVVVLAPHEDAAPMGQVIRNNGQPVPPGLHHCLHVMQAGVAAQVSWLEPCINLGRLLQLNYLLCRLERKHSLSPSPRTTSLDHTLLF